ncbi:Dimer_Tnp_hAT domain-containing protein, partial [Cephalotus follicularis]
LNDHFTKVNTKLFLCMDYLNLINHFLAFNTEDLVSFTKFYPIDFSTADLMELKNQLETYIIDMCSDIDFTEVNDIGELAKRIKEKNKDKVYPLVYMLLKLALILPVSTATMERTFSAVTIIKNRLRN